jgi:thymidine kinase
MFSGKTSRLVSYIDRCKYQRRSVVAFKPSIDGRYDGKYGGGISTHTGARIEAVSVKNGSEILKELLDLQELPQVVAVDEVWMIPGAATALIEIYRMGISVVASSIDLLANGKELQEVQRIMSWATHIEKCPAVCIVCGQDAFYSHMKVSDDRDVAIGGEELYAARCFTHHATINQRTADPQTTS